MMPDEEQPESCPGDRREEPAGCICPEQVDRFSLTLENIIDMTGEMEHLNELVMNRLAREGGFSGQQSYFTIVTPILDQLEIAIRRQYHAGMGRDEIKLLIRGWIDREIAGLQ